MPTVIGVSLGLLLWLLFPSDSLRTFFFGLYLGLFLGSFALLKSKNKVQEAGITWLVIHSISLCILDLIFETPKLSDNSAD